MVISALVNSHPPNNQLGSGLLLVTLLFKKNNGFFSKTSWDDEGVVTKFIF